MVATINISPQAARRKVTGWVVSEVGNMLMGERPKLVVGKRTVWRVPVVLGSSTLGVLGKVGTVDVDAETGEILLTETLSQEILQNAKALELPDDFFTDLRDPSPGRPIDLLTHDSQESP